MSFQLASFDFSFSANPFPLSITHLLFDCDGVIVDSEIMATRIALVMLAEYGYRSDEESHCRRFSGMLETDILKVIFSELGRPQPSDLLPRMKAQHHVAFRESLQAIPGMAALMVSIRLPISIVSNSGVAHVEQSLKLAGVDHISEGRIYSAEQVAAPKPAPDVYLHALAQIGLPPAQCLVVEDSVAGVTAAKAAGLTVIGFLGASHIFEGHDQKLREIGVDYLALDAQDLTRILTQLLPL